ncbi:MAG: HAD family hydrolase [Christensenellaceae bacterium]|jgi:HAD superfamily hydrolase (TIGR01484 family)|nr:HAD family hydrolase [Christensenellaceae bacterium]
MKTKAIFIDLDGTLFNSKREISACNKKALEDIKARGYMPVICTGRTIERVISYQIDSVDYVIFNNGGGILDAKNNKVIFENLMKKSSVDAVRDLCKRKDIQVLTCNSAGGIVMLIPISADYDLMRRIRPEILAIPHVAIVNQSKIITDPNFPIDATFDDGVAFFDVVDKDSSKGNGITKFCEIMGIAKADRIAIGDDLNDLTMFDACGYNVAMGNAISELKNRADFVADTNDNGGVAKFLKGLPDAQG